MGNLPLVLFGIVTGVVVLSVSLFVNRWRERVRERMRSRLKGPGGSEAVVDLTSPLGPQAPRSVFQSVDQGFERLVQQTGLEVEPAQVLGVMLLLSVALGGGLYLWREEWWLGALGAFVGSAGVLATLWLLRNRYREKLQNQLPDSFYLLARSLRAGLSLEQAITLSGEQGLKPLAHEWRRCAGHLRLGLSISGALQLMAQRLQLLDLNVFVSTIGLYNQTGGNLSTLLDRLAQGARERNQFRAYFRSATALARSTAIALGSAAPVLLLGYAIFQPDIGKDFFQSQTGLITVACVLALELIGALWLYRLLQYRF